MKLISFRRKYDLNVDKYFIEFDDMLGVSIDIHLLVQEGISVVDIICSFITSAESKT